MLADELNLEWTIEDQPTDGSYSMRELIWVYTPRWKVPQLADLGRRIVDELDLAEHYRVDLVEPWPSTTGAAAWTAPRRT